MGDTELDEDLIEVVLTEALESLESALWTLRAIDYGPQSPEVVASLFRCFHSIKGNTAMAGRTPVSKAAHRVENVLDVVREQKRPLAPPEAKVLIEVVDLLHPLIEGMEDSEQVWTALNRGLERLEALFPAASHEAAPLPMLPPLPPVESVAIGDSAPTSSDRFSVPDSEHDEQGPNGDKAHDASHAKLKVDVQSIMDAMTVAGELFQIDERLKFFVRAASAQLSQEELERWDGLTQISREFDASIERLYEQLIDIQRLPVSQLTGPLERSVRDICRKTGKSIEFTVRGRDLRIDKNVIQALKDPLMHMVRNASDHGAESPTERVSVGKPPAARVVLTFEDAEDTVVVTLSDDGRGMDRNRILQKAIEKGLIEREAGEALTPEQVIQFIFHPGFSTAAQVSELSGRGVGMDVVAKSITSAGGVIETRTELGKGSTFRISIPKLGSPVVDGLAVRSGHTVYLIPVKNVLSFMARSDFKLIVEPRGQLSALFHNRAYPLTHLPGESDPLRLRNERTIGVLVEDRRSRRGIIVVDEVLGRRRALSQRVRYEQCHIERNTSIAILGDGTMGFTVGVEDFLSEKLLMNARSHSSLEYARGEDEPELCAS
jgi:two-component system, chemotaxis family, sensor kinase CheA